MERGTVYIIPNENIIPGDYFKMRVVRDHLEAMNEFSRKYNLNYNFKTDEYQDAPCILANDGNLIAKTIDEYKYVIFYIPKIVTDNQNMWFYQMLNEFGNYNYVGAFLINDSSNDKIEGVNEILQEVNKRCMKQKMEEFRNVR